MTPLPAPLRPLAASCAARWPTWHTRRGGLAQGDTLVRGSGTWTVLGFFRRDAFRRGGALVPPQTVAVLADDTGRVDVAATTVLDAEVAA